MRITRRSGWTLLCAFVISATACSDMTRVCPDDLRVTWTPADTTIAVGAAFTPRARLWGCAGTQELPSQFRWESVDSTILRADSASGRATGVRAGSTTLAGKDSHYSVIVQIAVTVLGQ